MFVLAVLLVVVFGEGVVGLWQLLNGSKMRTGYVRAAVKARNCKLDFHTFNKNGQGIVCAISNNNKTVEMQYC